MEKDMMKKEIKYVNLKMAVAKTLNMSINLMK